MVHIYSCRNAKILCGTDTQILYIYNNLEVYESFIVSDFQGQSKEKLCDFISTKNLKMKNKPKHFVSII